MPKFMFVYREGSGNPTDPSEVSPEEMQVVMQAWMDWIKGGMEAGWMVEGGDALKPQGKVVHPDSSITDGPFAESKELVGGYSMVEAESLDAAVALTHGCPMFAAGGTVEVRELVGVEVS
jgi:hypothetical protein